MYYYLSFFPQKKLFFFSEKQNKNKTVKTSEKAFSDVFKHFALTVFLLNHRHQIEVEDWLIRFSLAASDSHNFG